MLEKVDRFFAGLLHIPLLILCKASGRDNFFFSRVAWCITLVFTATYWGLLRDFLGNVLLICFLTMTPMRLNRIKKAQELAQATTSVLTLPGMPLGRLLDMWIAAFMSLTVIVSADNRYLWVAGAWLIKATSDYFETDIQPKSKSPLRRAVEWLKAHPLRLSTLNPAPNPS